jgi:uncharacterized membrane protein
MNKRLAAAMGAYAVLVAIAVYLLRGVFLYAVLTLLLLLITRTFIAVKAGWLYTKTPHTGSIREHPISTADSNLDHSKSSGELSDR